jgi:hypothetical protein
MNVVKQNINVDIATGFEEKETSMNKRDINFSNTMFCKVGGFQMWTDISLISLLLTSV